jgi:hypothetical protein
MNRLKPQRNLRLFKIIQFPVDEIIQWCLQVYSRMDSNRVMVLEKEDKP